MQIRNVIKEDIENIFSMTKKFASSFVIDKGSFEQSFLNLIKDENSYCMLAEDDGNSIGYILAFIHSTLYANGKVALVEEIFVESEYRKKGIGKRLMEAIEEWAKNQGAILISASTRRAEFFYKSIGYKESAIYFRKLF